MNERVELKIDSAITTLDNLIADGHSNTFDLAFIDADKTNYPNYYEKCLTLVRPGGLVCIDNVFWAGDVTKPESEHNDDTRAIHQLNKKIYQDSRVTISMLPVADGLTLCKKK